MTTDDGYTLLIVTTIHDPGYSIARLANFVWIDWIGIMKLWETLSIHIKNQLFRLIEFYQMLILGLPMIILQIKCFFSLFLNLKKTLLLPIRIIFKCHFGILIFLVNRSFFGNEMCALIKGLTFQIENDTEIVQYRLS